MSSLNKTFMRSKYTLGSPSLSPKIKNLGDWHQTITSGDRFIDDIHFEGENARSLTRENKFSNNDLAISCHFDSSIIAPPTNKNKIGNGMTVKGSSPKKFKAVKAKHLDYSYNDKQKEPDKTK